MSYGIAWARVAPHAAVSEDLGVWMYAETPHTYAAIARQPSPNGRLLWLDQLLSELHSRCEQIQAVRREKEGMEDSIEDGWRESRSMLESSVRALHWVLREL